MFNDKECMILEILKNRDWVSGEELAKQLHISRTAVWKYIKKLKNYNYKIISAKNRGYKIIIKSDLDPIVQLKQRLCNFYKEIFYMKEIESTQEYAIRKMLKKRQNILIIAEKQTKARGRNGIPWVSPEDGIYFSVGLAENLHLLSMLEIEKILEDSISCVLSSNLSFDVQIKNSDILLDGKKVGGILREHFQEASTIKFLIFGVGIYTKSSPEGLWNINKISKKDIDRWQVLADIIYTFSNGVKKRALEESNPQPFDP